MNMETALEEFAEEVTRAVVMEEDEAWVGPERSVKSRFLELLEQHPELTRPQAYMQAVMEITEPAIEAAAKEEDGAARVDAGASRCPGSKRA